MNEGKIPVRYARALFQSAAEKNQLDRVYQDMILISSLSEMAEMKEVLASPVITPSKKKEILTAVLGNNVEKITLSLVDLLVKNGRENFLPAIARVFRDDTLKYKGITQTSLTTAVPVSEKLKKQVADMVASAFKTKVELRETVDSEIIGGFILRINDSYIDGSVRTKLRKVKKGLSAGRGGREL
jgi:F-type H+-transporting ATPase subunit delta